METLTLALKEWAAVILALETGRQSVLFRKGGIKEVDDEFVVEQNRFLLYPTYEHHDAALLKPEFQPLIDTTASNHAGRKVRITSFANVVNVTLLKDRTRADELYDLHIWNQKYVDLRFGYKPEKPLYVITLDVKMLEQPLEFTERSEYIGCRSWVELNTLDLS